MSIRFKNALLAEIAPGGYTEFEYGMAQRIDGDPDNFLFSKSGLCDNWKKYKYADVESYQSLDPVKCSLDGRFYPFYKIKFR